MLPLWRTKLWALTSSCNRTMFTSYVSNHSGIGDGTRSDQSQPTNPSRYMQDNMSLRKGLGAAVGLHFNDLPAESQLEMMKAMTTTRHKKVRQTDKPHRGDLRFINRTGDRPTHCVSRLANCRTCWIGFDCFHGRSLPRTQGSNIG